MVEKGSQVTSSTTSFRNQKQSGGLFPGNARAIAKGGLAYFASAISPALSALAQSRGPEVRQISRPSNP